MKKKGPKNIHESAWPVEEFSPAEPLEIKEGETVWMTADEFWYELGLSFSGSPERAKELVQMMKEADEN